MTAIGDVVRRFYEDIVATGDLARVAEFIGPDYLDHNAPGAGRGPEVLRAHMAAMRRTFPDFTLVVEDMIVEADRVATRVAGHGTHRGEWMNIKPTGKAIQLKGINIDRVADGRIVEHWGEANTVGMLIQMGVNPFGSG